jgi:hypothetical protein
MQSPPTGPDAKKLFAHVVMQPRVGSLPAMQFALSDGWQREEQYWQRDI